MVSSFQSQPLPQPKPLRIGILLSGQGSNAQALYRAEQVGQLGLANIVVVASNKPAAGGVLWAKAQGLPTLTFTPKTFANRQANDAWLAETLGSYDVELLVLAGYNRIVTAPLLTAFSGRMLNIHPSLLPRHGGVGMVGLAVHTAVLASGDTVTGCTVHEVTATVDGGHVLGQVRVPVMPHDTPESLAARVLMAEHKLYPAVVASYVKTRLHTQVIQG